MSFSEQDFLSIRDAAKKLNISIDQVTFHIEEGRLTGYLEVFDSKILERFRPLSSPPMTKLFRWKAIGRPVEYRDNEVRFTEAIIYDEHFRFHNKEISTSHRPFRRPIDSIMLNAKEVDSLIQKLSHRRKNKDQIDSLDSVIRYAVNHLNEAGKNWNYNDVLRRVNWLREHDNEVARVVQSVDMKNAAIHWKEEAVGVNKSTSKRTIQNRLTALYPKKSRSKPK